MPSEEVQQEALVRNLDSFARFLEVAALNGQIVNVAGIARDTAVARPTVQGYFSTLIDTLVGVWLPPWRRRAKVKEVASPNRHSDLAGLRYQLLHGLAGTIKEARLRGVDRALLVVNELVRKTIVRLGSAAGR